MRDFFRLKVVSKRQVTLPQLMLTKLGLEEGDELEFEVEGAAIVAVRPMKLVPTDFFNQTMLKKLEERSKSMDAGRRASPRDRSPVSKEQPEALDLALPEQIRLQENERAVRASESAA